MVHGGPGRPLKSPQCEETRVSRPWRWCCFAALLATTVASEALGQAAASTSAASRVTLDLPAGMHALAFLLGTKSGHDLRVELADAPGSAAQVQIVGGK